MAFPIVPVLMAAASLAPVALDVWERYQKRKAAQDQAKLDLTRKSDAE